jgi:EpsI family protein
VALLVIGWGVARWISAGYEREGITPPPGDLEAFPMTIAGWQGEDAKTDDRITGFLQTIQKIDRNYHKPSEEPVLVHAVWTEDYVKIHFPDQCYTENGFEKVDRTTIHVKMPNGVEVPMARLRLRNQNQEFYVLYWFQIGDKVFLSRADQKILRQTECWGKKQWPPLVKGMLQTRIDTPEAADARLREMAAIVYCWINEPEKGDGNKK